MTTPKETKKQEMHPDQESFNKGFTVTKENLIKRVITDNESIFSSGVLRFAFDVKFSPNDAIGMNHLKINMPMAILRKRLIEEKGVKKVEDVENYEEIFGKKYPGTPVTSDMYHYEKLYTLQGVTKLTVGSDEDIESSKKKKEKEKRDHSKGRVEDRSLRSPEAHCQKRYVKDKIGAMREIESDDSDFDDFEGTEYTRDANGELVPSENGDDDDFDEFDEFDEFNEFGKKKKKAASAPLKTFTISINVEDILEVIPQNFPTVRIMLNFTPLMHLLPPRLQKITIGSEGGDYKPPEMPKVVGNVPFGLKSSLKLLDNSKVTRSSLDAKYSKWDNFKDSDDEEEKKDDKKESAKIEEIKD